MKSGKINPRVKKPSGSVLTVGESSEMEMNSDWRLPSGKSLEEFALEGGYLAPLLLKTLNFGEWLPAAKPERKRS